MIVRLWVPQTRLTSCDLLIFVEKASEPVESADASRVIWPLFWERARGSGLGQGAVRAVMVEVVFVFGQHCSCVALVDDEDPVEEFSADAADEPLGDRVGSWGSNWRFDHLASGGSEDRIEAGGELAVAVPDEEAEVLHGVVEVHREIPGLLGQPRPGGVRGDAEDVDLAGGVVDDEERVEPGQGDGVEVEQVAGQDGVALGSEELCPGRPGSLW